MCADVRKSQLFKWLGSSQFRDNSVGMQKTARMQALPYFSHMCVEDNPIYVGLHA